MLDPVDTYLPPHSLVLSDYFPKNGIDALLFIGQHSMAGTPNGNLAHTMSSKFVEYYKLNDHFIGEFGLRAAIAGELGIPTIFISGDNLACLEARNLIPNIVECPVKKSLGLEQAEALYFSCWSRGAC